MDIRNGMQGNKNYKIDEINSKITDFINFMDPLLIDMKEKDLDPANPSNQRTLELVASCPELRDEVVLLQKQVLAERSSKQL